MKIIAILSDSLHFYICCLCFVAFVMSQHRGTFLVTSAAHCLITLWLNNEIMQNKGKKWKKTHEHGLERTVQYEPKKFCLPGGSRQAPLGAVGSFCLQTGLPALCSPLSMARHLCEPTGTKGATCRYRQVRPLWPGPRKFFLRQTALLMAENSNVYQMITTFHIVVVIKMGKTHLINLNHQIYCVNLKTNQTLSVFS